MNTITTRESLVFYGITAAGTLRPRELFRYMDQTDPQWWVPASGMTRHEYSATTGRVLVARSTTIRTHATDLRTNEKVLVQHTISHGTRARPGGRDPEYGVVDHIQVTRESTGQVLSDFTAECVWLELGDPYPRVATTPPPGVQCTFTELPDIPPPPPLPAPATVHPLHWTIRETDANGHISFPCYYDRAENTLADTGIHVTTGTWQAWYRQESLAQEPARLTHHHTADTHLFGFAPKGEHRHRVTVRFTTSTM